MTTRIRGSDVYTTPDIERIMLALAGASGRYSGEYGAGYADALRDLASAVGASIAMPCERIHEVIEYRHERTIERHAPAQVARQAPVDMTGDDVNIATFWQRKGRLSERSEGYVWVGDDGYTAFWHKADWQQVTIEEMRRWGELMPDEHWALVRHAYANRKRAEAASRVSVLPRERGLLR